MVKKLKPKTETIDENSKQENDISLSRVQIQTHSFCNASCIMCPYPHTSKTQPQGKMKWELFCKIIDDLKTYPNLQLVSLMLQNEPLLNKNLINEITYVRQALPNIQITISTNGSLLTPELVTKLSDAGLGTLIFSINGLTKKTFESIEQGLDFDIVYRNLLSFIKHKPEQLKAIVKCMVVKNSAIEFGLPERFSELPGLLKEKKIHFDISPISNRAGSLSNYNELIVFENLQSSKKKTICKDIFKTLNVLYNGDVISCCADWNRESVLGNLSTHTIAEVLLGTESINRKQHIKNGNYNELKPCKDCSQAKNIMENLL